MPLTPALRGGGKRILSLRLYRESFKVKKVSIKSLGYSRNRKRLKNK